MIDTHCHLLPGIDDGPPTLEKAAALARELHASGVTVAVSTAHYSRAYPTEWQDVLAAAASLRKALADGDVPLRVVPTAEVHPAYAVVQPLPELAKRALRERWLVVEALPDTPAALFETVTERLAGAGLVPVFAHPERAGAVQRSPGALDAARRAGALVQVLAPGLLGRWGETTEAAAWRLVERGTADLLGSDAHGLGRRRPYLAEAARRVAERAGGRRAQELVLTGPRRLLGGDQEIASGPER